MLTKDFRPRSTNPINQYHGRVYRCSGRALMRATAASIAALCLTAVPAWSQVGGINPLTQERPGERVVVQDHRPAPSPGDFRGTRSVVYAYLDENNPRRAHAAAVACFEHYQDRAAIHFRYAGFPGGSLTFLPTPGQQHRPSNSPKGCTSKSPSIRVTPPC